MANVLAVMPLPSLRQTYGPSACGGLLRLGRGFELVWLALEG
jgi:hypothetical protein